MIWTLLTGALLGGIGAFVLVIVLAMVYVYVSRKKAAQEPAPLRQVVPNSDDPLEVATCQVLQQFIDNHDRVNPLNFLESGAYVTDMAGEKRLFTITVREAHGKTPGQVCAELRDALRESCSDRRRMVTHMKAQRTAVGPGTSARWKERLERHIALLPSLKEEKGAQGDA